MCVRNPPAYAEPRGRSKTPGHTQSALADWVPGQPAGYPLRFSPCNGSSPWLASGKPAARRSAHGVRVPAWRVRSKAGRFRVPT